MGSRRRAGLWLLLACCSAALAAGQAGAAAEAGADPACDKYKVRGLARQPDGLLACASPPGRPGPRHRAASTWRGSGCIVGASVALFGPWAGPGEGLGALQGIRDGAGGWRCTACVSSLSVVLAPPASWAAAVISTPWPASCYLTRPVVRSQPTTLHSAARSHLQSYLAVRGTHLVRPLASPLRARHVQPYHLGLGPRAGAVRRAGPGAWRLGAQAHQPGHGR